jgi:hypothetical protein
MKFSYLSVFFTIKRGQAQQNKKLKGIESQHLTFLFLFHFSQRIFSDGPQSKKKRERENIKC